MISKIIKRVINIKIHFSSTQTIFGSFLFTILLGAILLSLPLASKTLERTDFLTCLFTSVSALCVTGLVVVDTATHWSFFGQFVILILIQIGGLGVIFIASIIFLFLGQKFSLIQRTTLQEALSVRKVGGVIKLIRFTLKCVIIIELSGAIILFLSFIKQFDFFTAVWYSVFHSISAFCNAGFDLMGIKGKFSSLTFFYSDVLVNIVIMLLIVIGGLGFTVWDNIYKKKLNFKRWTLQTKLVIITTIALIVIPATYFYLFEYNHEMGISRVLLSLFQSVTTRTAGFNTADFSSMTDVGKCLSIMLMLIGGSPGSTAGGMKTTTFIVLIVSTIAIFKRENEAHIFNRRIEIQVVKNAITIFIMYLYLFLICSFVICKIENLTLVEVFFEVASAIGTVGLSFGITSSLSDISKCILMILMFFGRVGGLTIIYSIIPTINKQSGYIKEDITVG